MMRQLLLTALLSALVSVGIVFLALPRRETSRTERPDAYTRVMQSGTLRCGYFLWPGFLNRDANTGAMSGMWVDFVEEVAKGLNLKVDWAQEINLGQIGAELSSGRIDAICGPTTATTPRATQAYFTTPVMFISLYAYARAGDRRFDGGMEAINQPDVSISVLEGESSGMTARLLFPKTKFHDVMTIQGEAQAMLDVAEGKADVVLRDPLTFSIFDKNHPGALERVRSVGALAEESAAFAVPFGDDRLRSILSVASEDLMHRGVITGLSRRYGYTSEQLIIPTVSPPERE